MVRSIILKQPLIELTQLTMRAKILFISTLLSLLFGAGKCVQEANDRDHDQTTNKIVNIIVNRSFQNGIFIQGASSAKPEPLFTLYPFEKKSNHTNWYVPQWGSRHLIVDSTYKIDNDTVIYSNRAKRITLHKTDNQFAIVGLEVFASEEYTAPRKLNEDWIHLLLEQKYTNFVRLRDINHLHYSTKVKLQYCENKMNDSFDPGLHTAQFTQFFTIQNRNKNSIHYGDFFWFGLSMYDYRYRHIEQYAAEDLGKDDASRKFIFSVASKELFEGSMHDLKWTVIDKDILPLIKDAFQTAQERGYLKETLFDDLYITSMNIGWEVPGTFDCSILFETPSLMASLKTSN